MGLSQHSDGSSSARSELDRVLSERLILVLKVRRLLLRFGIDGYIPGQ